MTITLDDPVVVIVDGRPATRRTGHVRWEPGEPKVNPFPKLPPPAPGCRRLHHGFTLNAAGTDMTLEYTDEALPENPVILG